MRTRLSKNSFPILGSSISSCTPKGSTIASPKFFGSNIATQRSIHSSPSSFLGGALTVIPDTYRDSIELMGAASITKKQDGIHEAACMMASESNRDMIISSREHAGLTDSAEVKKLVESALENDLIISIIAEDDEIASAALEATKNAILEGKKAVEEGETKKEIPSTIYKGALELEEPNLVLVSVPGQYAAAEAVKALNEGMNVFMFSDNVSVEEETVLKQKAVENDLLVMGPDCGTAILDGVPLGFANVVEKGKLGLVGASGTGLQEVSCLVEHLGEGVSHVIGVGGRDLDERVGGAMMLSGIKRLLNDEETSVIVLVSKPPSPAVAQAIFDAIKDQPKPFVVHFQGGDSEPIRDIGLAAAETLEEAALLGVALANGTDPHDGFKQCIDDFKFAPSTSPSILAKELSADQKNVRGLMSGGTFTKEAKLMFKRNGVSGDHTVIDLGDDEYTKGRPHPMIDFTLRNEFIVKAAEDPTTAVVLLDVVLGYGANGDPAGELVPAITEAQKVAGEKGRKIHFVAAVCGTEGDPQIRSKQLQSLSDVGVILQPTNAQAVRFAANIVADVQMPEPSFEIPAKTLLKAKNLVGKSTGGGGGGMFPNGIHALNIGLESFADPLPATGASVIHLKWKPPALGDIEVGHALASVYDTSRTAVGIKIAEGNKTALDNINKAHPYLVGVDKAINCIPGMGDRMILHSGPPVTWDTMCGPQQGAVIGAILYEKWADTDAGARELASGGGVVFEPCHEHSTVGPMAGIVSPSMPVFITENTNGGNKAYATMNEGLGKVLRFGAYSNEVLERLHWLEDVLCPTLQKTVEATGPIDLKKIIGQALLMGDECHNRSAAASLLFSQAVAPTLVKEFESDPNRASSCLDFVLGNAHFFLNMSMAVAKASLDAGHDIPSSTIATAMARNGTDFGLRVSGTGGKWFTAPSPVVDGLYFPGYSSEDANPDMGDSSITETLGIGGFSMAAAPAIVGFVGGTATDALNYTREMYTITSGTHSDYKIPSLNFQGSPLGIDVRKVVDSGVSPIINTGIAHKEAGVGQIGAGICRAPLSVFNQSVEAIAKSLEADWRAGRL